MQCTQERAYTPPRLMSRDSYSISVFEGADNYEMGAIVRKNAIKISKRTVDVLIDFEDGGQCVDEVEVEGSSSVVGAHQALKYRAIHALVFGRERGMDFGLSRSESRVAVWLRYSGITVSRKAWRGRHHRRKCASKEWHSKNENPSGKGTMPEYWKARSVAVPDDADNCSSLCARPVFVETGG